jgi:hypothetical protein
MRAISIGVLLLGVVAVIAGVVFEGTVEHPLNLFLPYLFGTGILEVARKRDDTWVRLGAVPIVLGASAAGVGWTLGPDHVTSAVGGLVWVGIAVAIAASAEARMTKTRTVGADQA